MEAIEDGNDAETFPKAATGTGVGAGGHRVPALFRPGAGQVEIVASPFRFPLSFCSPPEPSLNAPCLRH